MKTQDPYLDIQAELDRALGAADPIIATAATRRAALLLARAATSPQFDPRRSRVISRSLREAGLLSRARTNAFPPLVTR